MKAHWKIQLLRDYRGGRLLKKGGLDSCWFKVGPGKKEGGETPMHTRNIYGNNLKNTVALVMG